MFRSLAFATLLAATCTVHAAPVWTFSYTGFLEKNTGVFSDTYTLSGSFSGQDRNRDGYLEKNEITTFFLNGVDYIGCAGASNEFYSCGTDSFRYKMRGSELAFSAGLSGRDPEGYSSGGHYFTAGDGEYEYNYSPYSASESAYLWTDQTRFTIGMGKGRSPLMAAPLQVLAVPEPGTWAMLATGLLLVTGVARRQRRQPLQPVRG